MTNAPETEAPEIKRPTVTTWRRTRHAPDNPEPVTPAMPPREPADPDLTGPAPYIDPYAAEYPAAARDFALPDARTPGWRPWPPDVEQVWRLYFIHGHLPVDARWWLKLYDRVASLLFGPQSYLLYVGLTGQYVPLCRGLNHVIGKDWAPDIRSIEVGTAKFKTEKDGRKAEVREIRRRRPLHNVAHNVGNRRAADSALRKLPRHQRAARRQATRSWLARLSLTALVWWMLVSLAPFIGVLGRLLDSAAGRLMIVAWAAMLVFGAGRARRAARG